MRYETDLTKIPGYIIGDIIFATRGLGFVKIPLIVPYPGVV